MRGKKEGYVESTSSNEIKLDQKEDSVSPKIKSICHSLHDIFASDLDEDDTKIYEKISNSKENRSLVENYIQYSFYKYIHDLSFVSSDISVESTISLVNVGLLNTKQLQIYEIFKDSFDNEFKQIKMIIIGSAGTGKSFLLSAVKSLLKKHMVLCATTGKAALNLGGECDTIHNLLLLPVKSRRKRDLNLEELLLLRKN